MQNSKYFQKSISLNMDLYLIWIDFMCAQCIFIGQCVCGFYACSVCIQNRKYSQKSISLNMGLYLKWIVFMCAQCIFIGAHCVCGFYACSVNVFIGDRGMWFFIHVQCISFINVWICVFKAVLSLITTFFFVSQKTNSCFQ